MHRIFYLVAAFAHIPMGLRYVQVMWNKEHYQFFPLLIAAVFWLSLERLKSSSDINSRGPVIGVGFFLLISLFFLTLSSLLFRPEFYLIAPISLAIAYILDHYGWRSLKRQFAPLALLILVMPPLYRLDQKLVMQLQMMSSLVASAMLDAIGQVHFREGVVLVTANKQFFAEEACSGVRSLFSSLAAVGIFCCFNLYSSGRTIFNLTQTVLWVVVGNSARIAIVVLVADRWTESITTGTPHQLLGLGTFAAILLMCFCTDRLYEAFGSGAVTESTTKNQQRKDGSQGKQERKGMSALPALTLSMLFLLIATFSIRLTYLKWVGFGKFRPKSYAMREYKASDLPNSLLGWKQIGFKHELRTSSHIFGAESFVWQFEKGSEKLKFSVDGLYHEFHNLAFCYSQTGWTTNFRHLYDFTVHGDLSGKKQDSDNSTIQATEIRMSKGATGGYVLFSAFDRRKHPVIPQPGIAYWVLYKTTMLNHLRMVFGVKDSGKDFAENRYDLPITQFQLFLADSNGGEIQPSEMKAFYRQARKHLLGKRTAQLWGKQERIRR